MKIIQKELSIDLPMISFQCFRSSNASSILPLENE